MPLQTHPTPWKLAGQTALFLLLLWFTVSVFAAPSIVTVDTGGIDDVGQYTSLELNGAGNAVISYYDVTNGDLKLAICNNALCGAPTVIVLASAGVVGQYTSLELDITAGGVPVISFYDSLNTALNLVVCSDAVCTTTTLTVVDAPGVVGNYTSLALNGSNPVISYYDNIGGNLKLAVCSNPTCTVSTIVSPDAGGNVGRDTSIALNGGNPVISYFDLTNTNLKLLVCNDAVCASDLPITLDTLNTVGTFTSLSLTGAGNPVISYRDDTNSSLKVVICPNPACTGAVPITVDNAGNVGSNTSLTLTAGGCPVISYYDSAGALKVATYSGASCTLVTLTTLDTGDVGEFTSIELNGTGFPVISYYDNANGNLKLVTCDTATCAPLPTYTSNPAVAATVAITGAAASTANAPIAVTNTGAAGSTLDVALISVSVGYTVTGLPIVDQTVGEARNITVSCVVPQAAGTLIVETNEPGNPQYSYPLTCTAVVVPVLTPTPVTETPADNSASQVEGTPPPQPAFQIFDPAISKLGFLQPKQLGVTGEQVEWIISVSNTGSEPGRDIVIKDTMPAELRIDRVTAAGGTVEIVGQTVTVGYASLALGQTVQFSIFTTVLQGVDVRNTACVSAANLAQERCATGAIIRALPQTGETSTPFGGNLALLILVGNLVVIGIWSYHNSHSKEK